jgi:F420-dependent oxidoreductase-like protein
MKLAVALGTVHRDWEDQKSFVLECERIGVDSAWPAEFFGHDVFTPAAYFAAVTSRIRIGTGVVTLGARSPVAVGMAAMTVASMSGGRHILGIGASTREIVEGWYGMPFQPPAAAVRETITIVRQLASGQPLEHQGKAYTIPLGGGPTVGALEAGASAANVPIYVASLNPHTLRVTGEMADGWAGGMSFMPEIARSWFDPLAEGAARAGRSVAEIDVMAPTFMSFGDVEQALAAWKPFLVQLLGSVGAWAGNHHSGAYRRAGYAELCDRLRELWLEGKMAEAVALVPDDLVLNSKLCGDDAMVKARLRAYRDCGVTTLQIYSFSPKLTAELEPLARLKGLLDEVNAE